MALQLGTENKKQVYLLAALFAVIVGAGGYELYSSFAGPSTPPAPPPPVRTAAPVRTTATPAARTAAAGSSAASAQEAQKLSNADIDPVLQFDLLAQSEDVSYEGTGRNIFSANSAPPMAIPKPIQPPRPNAGGPAVQVAQQPQVPQPPKIDLKYFGYSESKDKTIRAFFLHGEDIFIATPGQIVDHRYRIENIKPGSVQVTDMGYNNTQTLTLVAF